MTNVENLTQESFHCSHCEKLGEIDYSCLERQQNNGPVKVWVKNLPKGISQSGVKNLFLTVGKPLSISFNPLNNSALVLFEFMNEAELAVRDLHCKPPYDLKVILRDSSIQNKEKINNSENNESWDFSNEETPPPPAPKSTEQCDEAATNEVLNQIKKFVKSLSYDPSVRIRQKKLDFKTDTECISLGRGYLYMGKNDRFVGGLQKFELSSENSKAKHEMTFSCGNCNALTTKTCGYCSASYCSKACLSSSSKTDHNQDCSLFGNIKTIETSVTSDRDSDHESPLAASSGRFFVQAQLAGGTTVIMSSYFTMRTVFVRGSDDRSEEKFARLCNDVAVEAFRGSSLENPPKVGDLVIGKYYEDLCFYRAQVCHQGKNKFDLFFIDFGNTQETNIEDIKFLPDHLKSIPAFAVRVELKDVPEDSSLDSVNYYNKLTAERISLILNFEEGKNEAVLLEKDSKAVVNEVVSNHILPSWKKDSSVLSKLGEIFYLDSMIPKILQIGKTCNLIVSHFDEKEFLESEVFWVLDPETDDFFHANSEMYLKIREYCEFLKDDYYLPRDNELCLAKESGEWHRCVNLRSHKTTCCLFFVDDGHSSFIDTSCIRKMIKDFMEAPSLAVCCTLPDDPKLKTNNQIQLKIINYLKKSAGQMIDSVKVLKMMGDAYCLSIPEINKMLE